MPGLEQTPSHSELTNPPSATEAATDVLSPADLPYTLYELLERYKNEAHRVCTLALQGKLDASASSYESLKEDLDEGDATVHQYLATHSFSTGADALKAYMKVLYWASPRHAR
jgi:hypothetical protein